MLKLHSLHKADLWNVESAMPTRAYITFPIFYCFLEFWKVFKCLTIAWDTFPDFWC